MITSNRNPLTQKISERRVASCNSCHRPNFAQSGKTLTNKCRASVSRPRICLSRSLKKVKNRNRIHAQPLSSQISSSSAQSHLTASQTKSLNSQALSHNTSIRPRRCFLKRRTWARGHKM